MTRRRSVGAALVVVVVAAACSPSGEGAVDTTTAPATSTTTSSTTTATAEPEAAATTTVAGVDPVCTEPLPGEVVLDDTSALADPDTGPDSWPDEGRYARFDTRDGPESSYRPCFVPADLASFDDDTVVIGVAIGGEARAYAIEQLVAHYVNDRFGDDPLLVSY